MQILHRIWDRAAVPAPRLLPSSGVCLQHEELDRQDILGYEMRKPRTCASVFCFLEIWKDAGCVRCRRRLTVSGAHTYYDCNAFGH